MHERRLSLTVENTIYNNLCFVQWITQFVEMQFIFHDFHIMPAYS